MMKTWLCSLFLLLLITCSVFSQESSTENPEAVETGIPTPENFDPEPVPETRNSDRGIQIEEYANSAEQPDEKTKESSQIIDANEETPKENDANSMGTEGNKVKEADPSLDQPFAGETDNQQEPDYPPGEGPSDKPGPSDEFIMEWEKVMGDFIPEDITTFKIEGKSAEVIFSFR